MLDIETQAKDHPANHIDDQVNNWVCIQRQMPAINSSTFSIPLSRGSSASSGVCSQGKGEKQKTSAHCSPPIEIGGVKARGSLVASTATQWRGKWPFWSQRQGSIPRGTGPVCCTGQLGSSKFTSWGYPAASTTNSHCLFISLKSPALTFTGSHVSDFFSSLFKESLWNLPPKTLNF